jgi:hypothetical protein
LTSQSFAVVSIASSRPGKSFFFSHYFGQVAFTLCKWILIHLHSVATRVR